MSYALRGREPLRELLADALSSAAAGQGRGVLIEGPAGSGRSRMLAETVSLARERGFTVCRAMADHVAHPAFLASLGLTPAGAPAARGADPLHRLAAHLADRSCGTPVLVALDDLQWAGPATLDALRTLSALLATRALPVLAVFTRASTAGDPAVDRCVAALAADAVVRQELEPLREDSVTALVADVLGAPPDETLSGLCAAADGVPGRAVELAEALAGTGVTRAADGRAALPAGPLPDPLREAVLRPLRELPATSATLLDVIAVLGRSVAPVDLALALGQDVHDLMPLVQECVTAGVLASTERQLVFRHALVWQAVREAVPPPVRSALAQELGERHARRGDFASAARHLAAALLAGERRALAGLERAGRELAGRAPRDVVALLDPVVGEQPSGPAEAALLVPLVGALAALGRPGRAAVLARAGLDAGCRPATAAELAAYLAEAELATGAVRAAGERADAVLDAVTVPPDARLRALAVRARARSRTDALTAVRAAADELRDEARRVPAGAGHPADAAACLLHGLAHWHEGRPDAALAELRRTPGPGGAPHPAGHCWDVRAALGTALLDLGAHDQARTVLCAAPEQEHDRAVDRSPAPGTGAPLAVLALETGDLEQADRMAAEVLGVPDDDRLLTDTLLALAVRAESALRRGRSRDARPDADRLLALLRTDRFDIAAGRALRTVLRVTEAESGPRAALHLLRDLCGPDIPGDHGIPGTPDEERTGGSGAVTASKEPGLPGGAAAPCPLPGALLLAGPATAVWLVRLARAGGEPELAGRITAWLRATAPASPGSAPGEAMANAADHAEGLLRESATLLSRAAAAYRDPWSRARAEEDLGTLLKDGDDTDRAHAVERLQSALQGYDDAGSAPDAARVRGTLRGLGVRRRHWTYADRPTTGWASLTDTERAVADLVAQGLTNRETADLMFLSPYTVNFHLRQIFRKLSITSRVELARMHRDLEQQQAPAAASPPKRRTHPGAAHDRRPRPGHPAATGTVRSAHDTTRALTAPDSRGRR
ncbi:LuxR C-terminal-related transcriptional regulator [Streptomyces sp. R17]|uniref:LuxR C-terminal-related transcriptional regulator n=1 Tax=Streptomyces sp. R17 TaxID=3238626 RepID=A0AB39NYQ9_9ACTN